LKDSHAFSGGNSTQIGLPISMPPSVVRRQLDLPPFSSLPLLLLVMFKPLTDAFYEVEAVKYGYILLLGCASLFAKSGQVFQGATADPRNKSLLAYIWLIAMYFIFQFGLVLVYGGNLSEIFKIVSPFVFFLLVAYAADRWLIYALAGGAVLTIVVNAAMLPFDFGWVNWGSVKTFKGYYYFKTDLAYALCFSVLLYAFHSRNSITPVLASLMLIAAVEVVLANSRLNYLSFLCVALFIAVKEGVSLRSIIRYGLLFGFLAVVAMNLYDPTKLLGFDTTNEAAFTQGRSVTWERLFNAQANSSPLEWLFGRGAFADLILSQEATRGTQEAHNAHNEILHLLFTQGIFGTIFYFILWVRTFRMSHVPNMPSWARGTGAVALFLFVLQSMTAVLSSFATKTWPLVMVLLALRGMSSAEDQRTKTVSPS
jgi:hypothetical protein